MNYPQFFGTLFVNKKLKPHLNRFLSKNNYKNKNNILKPTVCVKSLLLVVTVINDRFSIIHVKPYKNQNLMTK